MAREDAIDVEGVVVEALPNLLFRVELANGHRLLAHVPRRAQAGLVRPEVGDKVAVQLSPFDLSKGSLRF